MTVAEINREALGILWRYERDMKKEAQYVYLIPQLIGSAVGGLFSKSATYPKIEDVFPTLFPKEEMEEILKELRLDISAVRFLQFANNFNKNIKSEVKD